MNKKVIEKIVAKTGYSVTHVSNVIAGRRNNEEISKLYLKLTTPKTKKSSKKVSVVEKIVNKTGYSASHVRGVINGSRYNEKIAKLYNKYAK